MTTCKTVVSWLAFWFLTLKGLFLVVSPYHNEALPWLPLWALPGLLMMVPWFWRYPWKIPWIEKNMPFDAALAERCNLAGRWLLWGFLVAYHMRWLPDPFRIYLYHEAPVWEGFFFLMTIVVWAVLLIFLPLPEVFRCASFGFTGFIDAVFFPGRREAKPPYTLKLARFYREDQRLAEAEAEYARMLSFYPEQLEAWQERLDLAFQRKETAGPPPREVLALAIHALPQPRDKEAIFLRFSRLSQGILDQ
jgi:hypothetical protein